MTKTAFFHIAFQKWRGHAWMGAHRPGIGWKWAHDLLHVAVLDRTVVLPIAGAVLPLWDLATIARYEPRSAPQAAIETA
ncbi:hypothetical protein EWI61_02720 [Methylolobus aquaticus]|nr:hypothetical protein EWI61_02720 [Methylolobus aquaticus]